MKAVHVAMLYRAVTSCEIEVFWTSCGLWRLCICFADAASQSAGHQNPMWVPPSIAFTECEPPIVLSLQSHVVSSRWTDVFKTLHLCSDTFQPFWLVPFSLHLQDLRWLKPLRVAPEPRVCHWGWKQIRAIDERRWKMKACSLLSYNFYMDAMPTVWKNLRSIRSTEFKAPQRPVRDRAMCPIATNSAESSSNWRKQLANDIFL